MDKNYEVRGYVLVFLSAIFFYITTLCVKFISENGQIPNTEISFFRFFIGLIIVGSIVAKYHEKLKIVNKKRVFARAFFNTFAVILFYIVIGKSSTTKANIYNLTYPIFVTIFAPLVLKDEKWTVKNISGVVVAFIGILLISGITIGKVGTTDLLGLSMGLASGFAIISLRKARLTDDSITILFYLMLVGTVLTFILFGHSFKVPGYKDISLILAMGTISYLGQYTLTQGFRYITAVEGSVISASRIFIAAIVGILFLHEPIYYTVILGGILIFIGIVLVSFKKRLK